jgi:hypothetical protein
VDKIVHAGFGFFFALIFGFIMRNAWFGFAIAILAGAAKEVVWDLWLGKGTPELLDFVATFIGAALGLAMLLLVRF